jgi:5-methylcytosine-specific restriction enzyme subunit McrC
MHLRWRELDYLLMPQNGTPMVIDAKYKPRYHYSEPDIEDIRQVSAYARMEGVYKKLHLSEDRLIDCLIVYANQECPAAIPDVFDNLEMSKVNGYMKFHKIGISLPVRD